MAWTKGGQHILVPSKAQRSWRPMHTGADVPHSGADVLGSRWLCSSPGAALTSPISTGGSPLLGLSLSSLLGWERRQSWSFCRQPGCDTPSFSFSGGTDPEALPVAYPVPAGCARGCGKADKISVIRHRPSSKLG